MTDTGTRRGSRWILPLLLGALALAACTSPPAPDAPAGRSASDARVQSFLGQAPPDAFTAGTWVGPAGPTSLAALRGRVVYVQFAFPT